MNKQMKNSVYEKRWLMVDVLQGNREEIKYLDISFTHIAFIFSEYFVCYILDPDFIQEVLKIDFLKINQNGLSNTNLLWDLLKSIERNDINSFDNFSDQNDFSDLLKYIKNSKKIIYDKELSTYDDLKKTGFM
ncbi:MAG: hypothetical protein MJB14_21755 [Spirochaetes bacterium]|nr:hypothetical protein [Spirochaetota bacterium]